MAQCILSQYSISLERNNMQLDIGTATSIALYSYIDKIHRQNPMFFYSLPFTISCVSDRILTLSLVCSWKTSGIERESAFVVVVVILVLVVVGGGSVVGGYRRDLLALLTCWRRLIGEGSKEGGSGTEEEGWVESRWRRWWKVLRGKDGLDGEGWGRDALDASEREESEGLPHEIAANFQEDNMSSPFVFYDRKIAFILMHPVILPCYFFHIILVIKVKWKVYSHYLKSIGWFLSISTIVMNAIFQSFSIGSSVWLSIWSNDNQTIGNDTFDTTKRDMYLGVYGALGFGQGTFCIIR